MQHPVIVRPDSAEVVDVDKDSRMWLLADAADTGGVLGANRLRLAPGTAGSLPHYHARSSEAFYVLDGQLRILLGERLHAVARGGFVVVPPGLHHAFSADPHLPADLLITLTPGIDRFAYFRALPAVLRGELDENDLQVMHERFDVHFVESTAWSTRPATVTHTSGSGTSS